MSSSPSPCDAAAAIRHQAMLLGAYRCGFARGGEVDADARDIYDRWIADGRHGTMDYCERYRAERDDPRLLLPGARTVIVCAFNYNSGTHPTGLISRYALGADYHWVVRQRLSQLADHLAERYGATSRVCVDSAPIRERYWAQRAGVGFVGINNQLIIPGAGSYFFLGELVTDLEVEPSAPLDGDCGRCMACVNACPGRALDGKGALDARRCLSYLTIESKQCPPPVKSRCVYGCDVCQQVCPHNAQAPLTDIPEFAPRPAVMALTPQAIARMGSAAHKRLVAASAMRRIPLPRLKANLSLLDINYI